MSDITRPELSLREEIAISRERAKYHRDTDIWPEHDNATFEEYLKRFGAVLNGIPLLERLKTAPSVTVVDLMSDTKALVSLFKDLPQKDKLGIAVGLKDNRTDEEKKSDESLGVHVVAGDLTDPATWRNLNHELNGRKATLIVESARAGLGALPASGGFYAVMAQRAWNLLSEDGGILLAELENPLTLSDYGINPRKQAERLNQNGVPSAVNLGSRGNTLVRLQRNPESPSRLPLT